MKPFSVLLLITSQSLFAASPEVVYQRSVSSIVYVVGIHESSSKQGSGVIISPNVIATNCHVIKDVKSITVFSGAQRLTSSVTFVDADRDICLITSKGLAGPSVKIGSTNNVKVGQRVYAIGAPRGLAASLSEGLVSALRNSMIQTTAQINPGSSGGGLFDDQGKLIGLTTFSVKDSEGLNFALPVDWVIESFNKSKSTTPLRTSLYNADISNPVEGVTLAMSIATSLVGIPCPFDKPPELNWKNDTSKVDFENWSSSINTVLLENIAKRNGKDKSWRSKTLTSASDPAKSIYYEAIRSGINLNLASALAMIFSSRGTSGALILPISRPALEAVRDEISKNNRSYCWDPAAFRLNLRLALMSLRGYLDEYDGNLKQALFAFASIDAEMASGEARDFTSEVLALSSKLSQLAKAPRLYVD